MTFLYLAIASSMRPASRARSASSIRLRAISGTSCWARRKRVERMRKARVAFFRALEVYFDLPEHFTSSDVRLDAEHRLARPFVEQVLANDAEAHRLLHAERGEVVADARVEQRVARQRTDRRIGEVRLQQIFELRTDVLAVPRRLDCAAPAVERSGVRADVDLVLRCVDELHRTPGRIDAAAVLVLRLMRPVDEAR